MLKFMLLAAMLSAVAECPQHAGAVCNPTGHYTNNGGHQYQKYHCSCGDDVWVRSN